MIGKMIGAIAGAKAAEGSAAVGGAGGALLGIAGATLLKRLSLPALIVLTAGGYALKKLSDRADEPAPAKKRAPAKPRKTAAKAPRKTTPKAANAA